MYGRHHGDDEQQQQRVGPGGRVEHRQQQRPAWAGAGTEWPAHSPTAKDAGRHGSLQTNGEKNCCSLSLLFSFISRFIRVDAFPACRVIARLECRKVIQPHELLKPQIFSRLLFSSSFFPFTYYIFFSPQIFVSFFFSLPLFSFPLRLSFVRLPSLYTRFLLQLEGAVAVCIWRWCHLVGAWCVVEA